MKAAQSVSRSSHARASTPRIDPKRSTQQIEDLLHLMSGATEKAVLFEIEAPQDSRVCVAGTFNDWNPTSHPLEYHPEDEVFRATLLLAVGTHEYKFVVDGVWQVDVKCPCWVLTENGVVNSVIHVQ